MKTIKKEVLSSTLAPHYLDLVSEFLNSRGPDVIGESYRRGGANAKSKSRLRQSTRARSSYG